MEARRRFEASAANVRSARRFATETLIGEGRPELVAPASLVVSELASNAIRHARSDFEVDVRVDGLVSIGVTDDGPGEPARVHLDVMARSGRGLAIVESVCRTWGVEPRPPGKRVWCVLDEDGGAATAATAEASEPGVAPG